MSRFNSLEFNDNFDGSAEPRQTVKDEAFYVAEAKTAFEGGEFEKALRNFAKVMEFNSGNVSAWAGQVRALIELGEFQEAKLWADKALEKFPDAPELLAAKAVAVARLGDLKAALTYSDASIEERGDTPYVWLARGDVLMARKENRAAYCFEKAMMLAPRDWAVRWLASRIHAFYKKFSIGLKYAQEALNLDSTKAAVWLQVGQCQLALGLLALAENSFTQAQQLDPHCSAATAGLARIADTGFLSRFRGAVRQLFYKR